MKLVLLAFLVTLSICQVSAIIQANEPKLNDYVKWKITVENGSNWDHVYIHENFILGIAGYSTGATNGHATLIEKKTGKIIRTVSFKFVYSPPKVSQRK
jgi:hypothetical protein